MINKLETGFDFFIKANRDLVHSTRKNAKDTMVKFFISSSKHAAQKQHGSMLTVSAVIPLKSVRCRELLQGVS